MCVCVCVCVWSVLGLIVSSFHLRSSQLNSSFSSFLPMPAYVCTCVRVWVGGCSNRWEENLSQRERSTADNSAIILNALADYVSPYIRRYGNINCRGKGEFTYVIVMFTSTPTLLLLSLSVSRDITFTCSLLSIPCRQVTSVQLWYIRWRTALFGAVFSFLLFL